MYIYAARIQHDDCWYADFPAFEGKCHADGETREEVVQAAAETLKLVIATFITEDGFELPEMDTTAPDGGILFAVEVDDDYILRTSCLTVGEAAEELGVSHSRVCALLKAGKLEAVKYGNGRLVTISSIERHRMSPGRAGRPRKA